MVHPEAMEATAPPRASRASRAMVPPTSRTGKVAGVAGVAVGGVAAGEMVNGKVVNGEEVNGDHPAGGRPPTEAHPTTVAPTLALSQPGATGLLLPPAKAALEVLLPRTKVRTEAGLAHGDRLEAATTTTGALTLALALNQAGATGILLRQTTTLTQLALGLLPTRSSNPSLHTVRRVGSRGSFHRPSLPAMQFTPPCFDR